MVPIVIDRFKSGQVLLRLRKVISCVAKCEGRDSVIVDRELSERQWLDCIVTSDKIEGLGADWVADFHVVTNALVGVRAGN